MSRLLCLTESYSAAELEAHTSLRCPAAGPEIGHNLALLGSFRGRIRAVHGRSPTTSRTTLELARLGARGGQRLAGLLEVTSGNRAVTSGARSTRWSA